MYRSGAPGAGLCYQARILKSQDGREKTYALRYGVEPIRLAGRDEPWHLVAVAGFGEEPIWLLPKALAGAREPRPSGQSVHRPGS